MRERLQTLWRHYRKPLILLAADAFFYTILGGPTAECSRCPMPPMSPWERGLFVGVWWIVLIAMARSSSEFTDLDG